MYWSHKDDVVSLLNKSFIDKHNIISLYYANFVILCEIRYVR